MQLQFVTFAGPKVQDDVYEVILPTADGNIAVYPQHMPLVTTVVPGIISVRRKKGDADEQRDIFATNGGIAEISGKEIRILVDEADSSEEIVAEEAEKALEQAKKLKAEAKDEVELERAEALIDRHAVQLKVAELRRSHRPK